MVDKIDIVSFYLEEHHLKTCQAMASKLLFSRQNAGVSAGGVSRIRNTSARKEKLFEDALVGQIGNCAGSLLFYGSMQPYLESRKIADANPTAGDKGYDLPGLPVDFKASLQRKRQMQLLDFSLKVRPHERHKGIYYVLCVITHFAFKGNELKSAAANFIGWAKEDWLPRQTEKEGVFKGAYSLPASQLASIKTISAYFSN